MPDIMTSLPLREEMRRRALYELGLSDVEMAKICGVAAQTIHAWRVRRGLPETNKGGVRVSKKDHYRRLELYWQGYTDMEIAKMCGISVATMHHWRTQQKLPPSYARDRKESLCWECELATPAFCSWIGRGEKVWRKAKKPYKHAGPIIIECRHFRLEGKEEAEMWEELERARLDYEIAEIEFNWADPEYREAASLKLSAARERLNAVLREAKSKAKKAKIERKSTA